MRWSDCRVIGNPLANSILVSLVPRMFLYSFIADTRMSQPASEMKAGDHSCPPFPKKVEGESFGDETDLAVNKRHRGSESRILENKWKANKVTCQHSLCCRGVSKKYSAITVRICIGKCRRIKTPGNFESAWSTFISQNKTSLENSVVGFVIERKYATYARCTK